MSEILMYTSGMKLTLKPKELLRALKNAILFMEEGIPDAVFFAVDVLGELDDAKMYCVGAGPFATCIDYATVIDVEDPEDTAHFSVTNYEDLEKFLMSVKDLKASPGFVEFLFDEETGEVTVVDRATSNSISLVGLETPINLASQALELTQGEFEYVNDWAFGFQPARLARLWRVKSATPDVPAVFSVFRNPLKDGYIMRIAVGPTCRVVLAGVNLTKTREYVQQMEIDDRCLLPAMYSR